MAVLELGTVAVLSEGEVGDGADPTGLGAGGRLDVARLHDVGLVGVEEPAADGRQQEQDDGWIHDASHGLVTPSQKPMLRRAVQ